REVEAPLPCVRVVEPEAQCLQVACRAVDLELDEVGPALPDLAHHGGAFVGDPGAGPGQGTYETREVRPPGSDLEVEVVLGTWRGRGRRREERDGEGDESQAHGDFPQRTRVPSVTQFVSQVLPPSSEKACSQRYESALMSLQRYRTRTQRPWIVSWSKNS